MNRRFELQEQYYHKPLYSSKEQVPAKDHRRLRIALVDDEPLARRALRRALSEIQNADVVAEYSTGEEAIERIRGTLPDLVFLDVEMPGINGLELARRLHGTDCPYIVFVTAFDHYALEAFNVQAIDYILKPISEEKVYKVMNRISERLVDRHWQNVDSRLDTIMHMIERQRKKGEADILPDRFTIKNHGRIYFVDTASIDWVQAEGNYVHLHTGNSKHLLRIKMNQLEERLHPGKFIRIHRSIIVNVQSITELRPSFNGNYLFLLKGNVKVSSSRGYRKHVEQILTQFF